MKFNTADKVSEQIELMKTAETYRAPQRALLNSFFNGEAPWTPKEAEQNRILINFNNKRGMELLLSARNQLTSAFRNRSQYFKVTLPGCKSELRQDWETSITLAINNVLTKSRPWYWTQEEVWGGVVLHGVSAKVWWDEEDWRPRFVGIQDILIPTDTSLSMENLQCFAVRRKMRPGALYDKTLGKGKEVNQGWKLDVVKRILNDYKDLNSNPNNYDWQNNPEQMDEIIKQGSGLYYDTDKSPEIWMWDFFNYEDGQNAGMERGWHRRLILDKDCVVGRNGTAQSPYQFVFDSNKPIASKLDEFIHWQFGDGNNVPPFKYHSIRSLAFLTYELVWTMNRLQCQFTQHVFEQLMTMLRINDPSDRARLDAVVLTPPFAIIPDGLQIVPAQERYKADTNMVSDLMAQYKENIQANSAGYTNQVDPAPDKERTKAEFLGVMAQTSALMAAVLSGAYMQEKFAYDEMGRRFTRKDSENFDVKHFQNECQLAGVPEEWVDSKRWNIEVERVMGGGNRSMALAEASELFNNREAFDAEGQQEIKHVYALTVTQNPAMAGRLAGVGKGPKVTDSIHDAEQSFGTLMLGVDMNVKEGLSHIQQVETLLRMMAQKVEQILASGGMGTPADVQGLSTVAKYIAKHLEAMGQDRKFKEQTKLYAANLAQLMNFVKAFKQRQDQAAKAAAAKNGAGGVDPEAQAKAAAIMLQTQAKTKAGELSTMSKLQQKQAAFEQKQAHKQQDQDLKLQMKAMEAQLDRLVTLFEAEQNARLEAMKEMRSAQTPAPRQPAKRRS